MRCSEFIGLHVAAAIALLCCDPALRDAEAIRRPQPAPHRSAVVRPARPAVPAVELVHITTHDSYALRPDGRSGSFSKGAMQSLTRLLRCHHTGKRHSISRRLIEILYATARHFNSAKVYVVAGYRAPSVAREKGNPRSPHKRGVACDFRLEDVKNETVRDYLRSKWKNVGVGYYPNSGFVHVDVERKKPAYWIDYSAPGERARYASSQIPTSAETPSENDRPE